VYKYVEQDSVVRDAQNVANCTAITTSLTKETLLVSSIEPVKVKDMIKACIDFLDDYAFMQSRINKLLNQSVALQVDEQILLGTGTAPEMNSIDSEASEFSAANAILVLTAKIEAANFVDLILGMSVQVEMLGLENSFRPNIVIVNRGDWFVLVESKKDANENYLDYRVTRLPNGSVMIGDLEVITSPIVAVNTCYVIDSTQGEILDRRQLVIDIAFENGTDWEADIVAIKGSERLNFLVPNEVANAFMKCSDVATAITAITAA
jgi:HK97 family phage major capsid protein